MASEPRSGILVVLDLDETLIHATTTPLGRPADFRFDAYHVYKRPQVERFLTGLSSVFPIAIWSSAGDDYVRGIVEQIRPANVDFAFTWGRSKCSLRRDQELDTYQWEKRLSKLKSRGYPLEQILIVDDSPDKCRTNYGNAIYVQPFTGAAGDAELMLLLDYLLRLSDAANVRAIEKRNWRLK